MRWLVVSLMLACGLASAQDEGRLSRIERDIASVDTRVRLDALGMAASLKDAKARQRILLSLTHDPAPNIRALALRSAVQWAARSGHAGPEAIAAVLRGLDDPDRRVNYTATRAAMELSEEDLQHVPADRITSLLLAVGSGEDDGRARLLSIIARQIDAGVAVSVSPMLTSALDAHTVGGRDASLACADRATRVAPLTSRDAPLLAKLLRREDTRRKTIGLLARARGAVAWSLLLEIEATTADALERERARAALDHHEGHAREFRAVLEDAARNAADPRVRDLALKRLDG